MGGNGRASSGDDCFSQFDDAFAQLESALEPGDAAPGAPHQTDLSEYEDAFSSIDRQLAAHPPAQLETPPTPSRPSLTLVAQPAADAPKPAEAPRPPSEILRPIASEPRPDLEEFWRLPPGKGTPIERLIVTLQNLLWLQRLFASRGTRVADGTRLEQVGEVFAEARRLCAELDLPSARVRVDFALAALEDDRTDQIATEIGELVRHIRHDLQACSIWPIARGRVAAFDMALNAHATKAFAAASDDLAEAGRCAGFGLHTASVFHTLRAAHLGRHALVVAVQMGVVDADAIGWPAAIAAVEAKLTEASRWSGAAKATATECFGELLHNARLLHDADRKLTGGSTFDEHHALVVLHAARALLNRLGDLASEPRQRQRPIYERPGG